MLAGTLNDVSLPDVLALLSQAGKTGSVHIVGEGHRGRIDLIGGRIGMAQSNIGRLGLIRRLVGLGLLDAERLTAGLEAAAASPDPDIQLVRWAYRAGALTAEVVRSTTEAHVVDAMFDLLRVESGRFRFDPCKVADLGVQRGPEDVLADVAERNREWDQIRASVPAPGAIVRMLPRISHDEVVLQASTWRLLSLVDGRRTVADLVNLLGLGEFEVSRSLHRLVGEGLVAVVVDVGGSHGDETTAIGHVAQLELELAQRRSDPSSQLAGRLEWDAGWDVDTAPSVATDTANVPPDDTPVDDPAAADPRADDAAADATDRHPPTSRAPVGEPPATDVVPVAAEPDVDLAPAADAADEWTDIGMPDAGDTAVSDVEEPEVYTTQLLGEPDDDDGSALPAPRRSAGARKGTLATATERRGRLLPEPEPGHDAEDLTRRLLEGVGKS